MCRYLFRDFNYVYSFVFFFFFKQKTAYEMRISDWSSDVCSSDLMRNTHLPARVSEPHSETAYTTDCALDFMRKRGAQPWALHLSYVKPHWPYMAPDPYHRMYGSDQCLPVVRNAQELAGAHPVLQAYRQHEESQSFSREECVRIVRPA